VVRETTPRRFTMGVAIAMVPTPQCPVCGRMGTVSVPIEKLSEVAKWRLWQHRPIQEIVPSLSADEREMLMTGLHPECWTEVMGAEDDE
jgi:hypothetical protein